MGVTTSTANAGATYVPIATYTVSAPVTNYTFTSIPTTYTDLVLVFGGGMVTADYIWLRMGNGSLDTGSNYSKTTIVGNGSSASSGTYANQTYIYPQEPFPTEPSTMIANFQNYSNTTTYKTCLIRSSSGGSTGATGTVRADVGMWRNTAAINTIQISTYAGQNFAVGSTFTLYGLRSA